MFQQPFKRPQLNSERRLVVRLRRLFKQQRPIRMVTGYLLIISGLYRWIRITYFGAVLRLSPNHLSLYIWTYPDFRADDVSVLKTWLRPGDVYVDAGANIGSLAAVAATIVGPSGQVIAIEANPNTFVQLRRNASSNMACVCVALGAGPGSTTISDEPADDKNRVGRGGIPVAVCALDSLVASGRIRLLKLDVEGYEAAVLRGASKLLQRTDVVYVEIGGHLGRDYLYGDDHHVQMLHQLGFLIFETDGRTYDPSLNAGPTRNLVAVSKTLHQADS